MLTKPTGASIIAVLSSTTGTATVTNFNGSTPHKVRIGTHAQPAAVNFGTSTTATTTTGILVPPNWSENFSLDITAKVTYVQVGAGTGGYISITPIA
jgi:hypothetical protein